MEFPCHAPCLCVYALTANRSLEFLRACWEESWPCEACRLTFGVQTYNGFEGEIVAGRRENGEKRAARRGLRPCSHEPWMETELRGGVKRRIVLHSKVLFRKTVRKKNNPKKECGERCVSEWRPPPPESGYEEGTVSITKIKWLLATLCWACPPFVYVVVSCSFLFLLSLSLSCSLLFVSISRLARFTL